MEEVLKKLTLEFFGTGKHKISVDKFLNTDKGFLLDVRSREEAESIAIQLRHHKNIEYRNIPINEVPEKIDEIPRDRLVAVFCPANVRSGIVYAYLLSKGFSGVRVLEGGYPALTEALKPGPLFKAIKGKN